MSAEPAIVKVSQKFLGLRPYILIEISDMDENDMPVFEMEFGGGLDQQAVTDLLIGIGGALDEEGAAEITPLEGT